MSNGARVPKPTPPLTLGTVQLGMRYGIGPAATGLSETTATAILNGAWQAGFTAIDTARAYGESESRIGRWLAALAGNERPVLISKFPHLTGSDAVAALHAHVTASLAALDVAHIDYYLAHRAADILLPGVEHALTDLVARGYIGAFGASIYDPQEALPLLGLRGFCALQFPLSIADMRAHDTGLLGEARARGIRLFARSLFVQGLLLQDPERLPPHLAGAQECLCRLRTIADSVRCTPAALALGTIHGLGAADSIVVGVDDPVQIAPLRAAIVNAPPSEALAEAFEAGRLLPADLADPRRWPNV